MSALEISELVVEYASGGYAVRPIDQFELQAQRGELIVLLGPSGSGKTTLLSCLGGILSPTSGRISVDGVEVTALAERDLERYRRDKVGFVFQAFNLVPSLSARENVAVPLLLAGRPRREALARADALLTRVGLADRGHHKPAKLSGGQQQRVAIARGLIGDPALLLADEPTANLDYISAEAVIRLLRELRDDGRVIVVSTHDARLVPIADRVVRMAEDADSSDAAAVTVRYSKGETIFRQGDRSDLVYVVESGEVEVLRELADGELQHIATVTAGRYFGEFGPMLGFPRSATVRAASDVELTAYGVREFRRRVVDTTPPAEG
jgi:putative ABC transport system ATP-binding protein